MRTCCICTSKYHLLRLSATSVEVEEYERNLKVEVFRSHDCSEQNTSTCYIESNVPLRLQKIRKACFLMILVMVDFEDEDTKVPSFSTEVGAPQL